MFLCVKRVPSMKNVILFTEVNDSFSNVYEVTYSMLSHDSSVLVVAS